MHTCAHEGEWVLFTWDLRRGVRGRRWFYVQLEAALRELPHGSWRRLGGSVYLVRKEFSGRIRKLLRRFKNPGLRWHELAVVAIMHTCA